MEDNTKELIKKDVFVIAKLCSTQDCSNPETAKKIYSSAMEKSIFMSPIGKSFQQRMSSVAKGDINEDLCLVCRKNIASNHAICPECLNKITNLQAKQTMNSSMTNQTNTENSTVNKKNASEIENQAKEFTQNLGSTAQEISANVKNVANAAQKKILDEMNSESAQEIKRKAITQAGEASDNIKKVANSAKAKWNDMTQAQKENSQREHSVDNPTKQTMGQKKVNPTPDPSQAQPSQPGVIAKANSHTTPINNKTWKLVGLGVAIIILLIVIASVGLGNLFAFATTIALCVLIYRFVKKLPKRNTVIFLVFLAVLTGIFYKDTNQNSFNENDLVSLIGKNISETNELFGDGKVLEAINAVNYANGLSVNYYSEDTFKIIFVSIESQNYGTLCNISISDSIDTVTEKMNELDAKTIDGEATEGSRNYSLKYEGKSMICGVIFQGGLVTRITFNEKNAKADI